MDPEQLHKWYESMKDEALYKIDKSTAVWVKYKNDLEKTKSFLSSLPKKVSHKVMVPLGPKAFVPGRIVHTNEFLVNLGDTWFVKRTAFQTSEICDRRIKSCDALLKKLEKEREFITNRSKLPVEKEAFGNEERPEIIEYVTEDEEKSWRIEHRMHLKKYRQKLAELKKKEKKPIKTEEDLWKRLDELELQEELEDELNRLNSNDSSEEDPECEFKNAQENENIIKRTDESCDRKSSRGVSFACEIDSSDEEPLRLEIKHTNREPEPSAVDNKTINTPSDIYKNYLETVNKTPMSVLKSNVNPNQRAELEKVKYTESCSDDEMDESKQMTEDQSILIEKSPINIVSDVTERNSNNVQNQVHRMKEKKVSIFKAFRRKKC